MPKHRAHLRNAEAGKPVCDEALLPFGLLIVHAKWMQKSSF
jgi:hypothetical protein